MTDQTEPSGVFAKAGQAPPPPNPYETPAPAQPALPATGIGRFAFHALIPSLLLPVIVVLLAFAGSGNRASMYDVTGAFVGVFCFILAGSMTLNAWLLLRHPESWRLRALPTGLSWQLVILWGLLVLLGVVVYFTSLNVGSFVLGFALMVLSVIVFVFAIIRRRIKTAVAPVVAVATERYWSILGIAYLVLVLLDTLVGVLYSFSGGVILAGIVLVPLGLPWAWPLGVLFALTLAVPAAGIVLGILLLAGVVFNVVVVVLLLFRPAFRTRFVNWFFKLRGSGDPQTTIRTFATPIPPVEEPPSA